MHEIVHEYSPIFHENFSGERLTGTRFSSSCIEITFIFMHGNFIFSCHDFSMQEVFRTGYLHYSTVEPVKLNICILKTCVH